MGVRAHATDERTEQTHTAASGDAELGDLAETGIRRIGRQARRLETEKRILRDFWWQLDVGPGGKEAFRATKIITRWAMIDGNEEM